MIACFVADEPQKIAYSQSRFYRDSKGLQYNIVIWEVKVILRGSLRLFTDVLFCPAKFFAEETSGTILQLTAGGKELS